MGVSSRVLWGSAGFSSDPLHLLSFFEGFLLEVFHSISRQEGVCEPGSRFWGVAKGSSVSWVAKFKGDKNSECKLSNGWSRSCKALSIELLLSAGI